MLPPSNAAPTGEAQMLPYMSKSDQLCKESTPSEIFPLKIEKHVISKTKSGYQHLGHLLKKFWFGNNESYFASYIYSILTTYYLSTPVRMMGGIKKLY